MGSVDVSGFPIASLVLFKGFVFALGFVILVEPLAMYGAGS